MWSPTKGASTPSATTSTLCPCTTHPTSLACTPRHSQLPPSSQETPSPSSGAHAAIAEFLCSACLVQTCESCGLSAGCSFPYSVRPGEAMMIQLLAVGVVRGGIGAAASGHFSVALIVAAPFALPCWACWLHSTCRLRYQCAIVALIEVTSVEPVIEGHQIDTSVFWDVALSEVLPMGCVGLQPPSRPLLCPSCTPAMLRNGCSPNMLSATNATAGLISIPTRQHWKSQRWAIPWGGHSLLEA